MRGTTENVCPLPKLDLPRSEWREYFKRIYGADDVGSLPTSGQQVDVLNLTALSSISSAARNYVARLEATFPRENAWGACFDGACGPGHFAGYVNVHCPMEFAWRLRLHVGQRDRGVRHSPILNNSWGEVTHCGGSNFEANAAYFYAARGSGLWINTGRTIAFGAHDDAVRHFLKRNCTIRGNGAHECDAFLNRMVVVAARQGYSTVQFVGHCDAKCNNCLHEVAVLQKEGGPACPPIAYRRGLRAQAECTCVEHSKSVGTTERPYRGSCASCVPAGSPENTLDERSKAGDERQPTQTTTGGLHEASGAVRSKRSAADRGMVLPERVAADILQLSKQPLGPCEGIAHSPIRKFPEPSKQVLEGEAALVAAIVAGILPTRSVDEARMKPMPMRFAPDLSHLGNCTACLNAEAWWKAVRDTPLRSEPGSTHLLIDEGALSEWSGVVLELEQPVKRRTRFHKRAADKDKMPPHMPGTVLYDAQRRPPFRAWMEDSKTQFFSESDDGLNFVERKNVLTYEAQPESATGTVEPEKFGKMRKIVGQSRPFDQRTFTVSRSNARAGHMAYLSAFHCQDFGHTPYPKFWRVRHGTRIPRDIWREAPRMVTGQRRDMWESTCLGYSSDGLAWRLFDLGHPAANGPPPLRDAGDTSNVVYWDFVSRTHRVVNRWNAALPRGKFGLGAHESNWWREVRGVRISSNDHLSTDSDSARAFTENVRWIFDKEGKTEHLRRHTYSMQVTPFEAENIFLGVLNVLEWPRLDNHDGVESLRFDVMRTYLATSRDGVHFDTGWVYAQQELIPHGRCREPPGCATRASLENLIGGWQEAQNRSAVLDELCCEFDHAITMPASELVTHHGKHHLYYEGRTAPHESRFDSKYPAALAVASWTTHRIAGVRRDPNAAGTCSYVTTKPINLSAVAGAHEYAHVTVNVGIHASDPIGLLVADVVDRCEGGGATHPRFKASVSKPVDQSTEAAVLRWGNDKSGMGKLTHDGNLPGLLGIVRFRFYLCGSAKLFSFTTASGPAPVDLTSASSDPAPPMETPPSSQWQRRIAEIQSSNVVYGTCTHLQLPRIGTCDQRGCLFSTWHLAVADDHGLLACSRKCTAACAECTMASFSWSEYTCACVVRCDVNALGFSHTVEDSHPELTEGHALMRPASRAKNRWPVESTYVFDYVTISLRATHSPHESERSKLPAFPQDGWRSTADWANGWLDVLRARRQAGLPTPGWGKSAPAGRFNATKGQDIITGGFYLGTKRGTNEIFVQP